jgi:hypothetical protein
MVIFPVSASTVQVFLFFQVFSSVKFAYFCLLTLSFGGQVWLLCDHCSTVMVGR